MEWKFEMRHGWLLALLLWPDEDDQRESGLAPGAPAFCPHEEDRDEEDADERDEDVPESGLGAWRSTMTLPRREGVTEGELVTELTALEPGLPFDF